MNASESELIFLGAWGTSEVEVPDQLTAVVMHNPPYVIVNNGEMMEVGSSQDTNVHLSGYLIELMKNIAEQLEVTVHYELAPPSGDLGIMSDDGSWTGLIGMLTEKKADIALAPFSWLPDRALVVDYVGNAPVMADSQYSFLVAGRSSSSLDSLTAVLSPFSLPVWISLIITMLVSGVVLYLTNPEKSDPRKRQQNSNNNNNNNNNNNINNNNHNNIEMAYAGVEDLKQDWISSLLSVLACITQQGWPSTPSPISARIVTFSARAMALIIYVQYTASLISLMTLTEISADVESVKEALDASPQWNLLIQQNNAIVNSWKTSKDETLRRVFERVRERERVEELTPYNVQRMLEPRTITFYEQTLPFFSLGAQACNIIPLELDRASRRKHKNIKNSGTPQFLVMRQHLPIKSRLLNITQKLYETGAVDRLRTFWFTNSTVYQCDKSTGYHSLAFADLSAVIYLLLAGVVASLLVLIVEKIYFSTQHSATTL